ncbi:MAG TPA: HAD family hydrolase, partial [Sphaerochaetaceae bacterium]|nr:HAD family hydrolase [Sphaerochaetaceae bacterium]
MRPPQWIVTDLDETLLDSNRAISKRAMIAIRQVRENGIKFAIATTRSKQFAQPYIDQLQPDAMVLSGGALGYISDELRYQKTIEQMHVHQLLGIFSESASVSNIILDTSDGRVDWTART